MNSTPTAWIAAGTQVLALRSSQPRKPGPEGPARDGRLDSFAVTAIVSVPDGAGSQAAAPWERPYGGQTLSSRVVYGSTIYQPR
jgi:hypothetical protein